MPGTFILSDGKLFLQDRCTMSAYDLCTAYPRTLPNSRALPYCSTYHGTPHHRNSVILPPLS